MVGSLSATLPRRDARARMASPVAATIPCAPSRSRFPGYDPPVRVVASADGSVAGDDLGAHCDSRLTIAALLSLLAIGLYAAALARPLLRSLNCVASVAEQAMLDPLTGTANRRGFRVCTRGRARTVGPAWPSLRARDRRPRRLQARQRSSRAWRGGRGARDAGRAAPGFGPFGGHGRPARRGGVRAVVAADAPGPAALAVAERARTAFAASGMRLKGGGGAHGDGQLRRSRLPGVARPDDPHARRRPGALHRQAARQESGGSGEDPGGRGRRSEARRNADRGRPRSSAACSRQGSSYGCDSAGSQ